MQATVCSGPTTRGAGRTLAQSAIAKGQRVRKTQPDGGFAGLGMSPWSTMRRRGASGSGIGAAAWSAIV